VKTDKESLCEFRDLESGSDEELALRGLWLSRLMFGGLVDPALQPFTTETRGYEEYLTAQGYRLV
jgi:hypothetical protein